VGKSSVTSGVQLTATVSWQMTKNRDFTKITVTDAELATVLYSEEVPSTQPPAKSFLELDNSWIGLKLDNERIIEIYSASNEIEEIVNIMRGIASAFQVSVASTNGRRTIKETDVLGTCETVVTQHRNQPNTVSITKHRSTDTYSKWGSCTEFHSQEVRSLLT
jgi:hypothetical protein